METTPQNLDKIDSGDANGAIERRRRSNEETFGIEAAREQRPSGREIALQLLEKAKFAPEEIARRSEGADPQDFGLAARGRFGASANRLEFSLRAPRPQRRL
jgi:hypothetical protein